MKRELSPLLTIDPSLTDDTVLYRTLDFFSATDLLTNNKLMFTRADQFQDPNEGIDRLLAQLAHSYPESGCGMGWTNINEAIKQHDSVKRSHYISCWSTNPESVAMWSLYSPDLCSIRISTTVSKLKAVISNLIEQYSLMKITTDDIGQCKVVAVEGVIRPVDYACLGWLTNKVSRTLKAQNRILEKYKKNGEKRPFGKDVHKNYHKRNKQRQLKELENTCNLKDFSFKHEEEVRLSVRLGECRLIESLIEDQKHYHSSGIEQEDVIYKLRATEFLYRNKVPNREFVDCPPNLIEEISVDPRCPEHKKKFIESWFTEKGIKTSESSCFGYIAKKFEVFPDR